MACPFAGKYAPSPEVVSELAGRTMRMLRSGDTDENGTTAKLLTDVKIPAPRPDEVLVHVLTAGIGGRSGSDIAGIVQMVGHGVQKFQVGDKVFSCVRQGVCAYAEYVVVSPNDLFHLPDDTSFSQGAALGSAYFTAYRALMHRALCRPGDTVLINNASGDFGVACCQLGCILGLYILVTIDSECQRAAATSAGANSITVTTDQDYTELIQKALEGRVLKAIVECAPHIQESLERDLRLVETGGSIVVLRDADGQMALPSHLLVDLEVNIMGCNLQRATLIEHREAGSAISNAVHRGWLRPLIKDEFPLQEVIKARQEVTSSNYKDWGSIIITI